MVLGHVGGGNGQTVPRPLLLFLGHLQGGEFDHPGDRVRHLLVHGDIKHKAAVVVDAQPVGGGRCGRL